MDDIYDLRKTSLSREQRSACYDALHRLSLINNDNDEWNSDQSKGATAADLQKLGQLVQAIRHADVSPEELDKTLKRLADDLPFRSTDIDRNSVLSPTELDDLGGPAAEFINEYLRLTKNNKGLSVEAMHDLRQSLSAAGAFAKSFKVAIQDDSLDRWQSQEKVAQLLSKLKEPRDLQASLDFMMDSMTVFQKITSEERRKFLKEISVFAKQEEGTPKGEEMKRLHTVLDGVNKVDILYKFQHNRQHMPPIDKALVDLAGVVKDDSKGVVDNSKNVPTGKDLIKAIELKQIVPKPQQLNKLRVDLKDAMELFDTDNDGKISRRELIENRHNGHSELGKFLWKALDKGDQLGNQQIDELRQSLDTAIHSLEPLQALFKDTLPVGDNKSEPLARSTQDALLKLILQRDYLDPDGSRRTALFKELLLEPDISLSSKIYEDLLLDSYSKLPADKQKELSDFITERTKATKEEHFGLLDLLSKNKGTNDDATVERLTKTFDLWMRLYTIGIDLENAGSK